MYTEVPVVFLTGSHSSEIEVKVVLVTVGTPGVGNKESSPVKIDAKFFILVKNSQLLKQLLTFCKIKKQAELFHHFIDGWMIA